MARLARDVLEHVFDFLEASEVDETGSTCRAWHAAATSQSLWLSLAEARWPAVSAMRSIVRSRGARKFYQARAAANSLQPEHLAFDASNYLMTLELEQHGKVVCSVAREASDVLCEDLELYDSRSRAAGLFFDKLDARFDCRSGNFIGDYSPRVGQRLPQRVKFTVCVVRKSDGLVAPLVPPFTLENDEGWGFGLEERNKNRYFPANPKLSGMLPYGMIDIPNQLGAISHPDDPGKIGAAVSIGSTNEFPPHSDFPNTATGATTLASNGFLPPWTPSEDPSVLIGEDGFVTLRKFKMHFEAPARDRDMEYGEEEDDDYVLAEHLSMDTIRRQLACKLRFS